MRRIPILATFVVLLAVATMIGLGIWQIGRAQWKEALLAQYAAAADLPEFDGLPADRPIETLGFRHVRTQCSIATPPLQLGGVNRQGDTGFRNMVGCALADGRVVMADLGWSGIQARPAIPSIGATIAISGVMIPDDVLAKRVLGDRPKATPLLIVLDQPVAGLQPSVPPSIEDIPNNHRSYAVQWFLFAAIATTIYLIALRHRIRAPRP